MNKITIRPGTAADLKAVYGLVKELAIYENEPDAVVASLEDYEKNYKSSLFDFLIAYNGEGSVVGMALYYLTWSTWKGRMMYLEDFVVNQSERGAGIGKLLFAELITTATNLECKLIKWQVLDWNEPAIQFYNKYPVVFEKNWWNVKLVF